MLEIVVKTENPPIIEGVKWVVLQNHSYAEIQEPLKVKINDSFYRIHLSENGGGMTRTGKAEIICSLDGRPLKPVKIQKKGDIALKEHAIFVGMDLILISAKHHHNDFTIKIERHTVDDETGFCKIDDIWFCNIYLPIPLDIIEHIPCKFKQFSDAIVYAMNKALCYHCRCIHYANIN